MLISRRLKTKLPIITELLNEPVDNNRNYLALTAKMRYDKEQPDKSVRELGKIVVVMRRYVER